jgi:hypothetical protein
MLGRGHGKPGFSDSALAYYENGATRALCGIVERPGQKGEIRASANQWRHSRFWHAGLMYGHRFFRARRTNSHGLH